MKKNENNNENKRRPNVPKIETFVQRSKDGQYILHRTVITDIRPVLYYEKVLENEAGEEVVA